MDTRKRGMRSLPCTSEYKTKKELAERNERRSFPICPPLATKLQKITSNMALFTECPLPTAVFFTKPVSLSRLFNPKKRQSYFDQVFILNDKIGEGSFGEVFKVQFRDDNRLYAVKQLKSSHNYKYGYAEVENCEKVGEHHNCVKFFMAWEELKIIHIQMEYCQLSLARYSQLTHNIQEGQLWEILHDMLKALEHLHKKNLIHLDVKPGNVMMSRGYYKLADFGLLVDLNKHDGRKLSTISDGDARYLACEVLDGVYTYSCDIFGLGISLLELATNIELPEFGPLWHQIRKDVLPNTFYKGVSRQFAITIEHMMSIVHWDRPKAEQLLKSSELKAVAKKDKKVARTDYCADLDEVPSRVCADDDVNIDNNNIVETPRRPLYDLRNSFSRGGVAGVREVSTDPPKVRDEGLTENNSPDLGSSRRSLSRVKLAF